MYLLNFLLEVIYSYGVKANQKVALVYISLCLETFLPCFQNTLMKIEGINIPKSSENFRDFGNYLTEYFRRFGFIPLR
jgi:hypothetical protein